MGCSLNNYPVICNTTVIYGNLNARYPFFYHFTTAFGVYEPLSCHGKSRTRPARKISKRGQHRFTVNTAGKKITAPAKADPKYANTCRGQSIVQCRFEFTYFSEFYSRRPMALRNGDGCANHCVAHLRLGNFPFKRSN